MSRLHATLEARRQAGDREWETLVPGAAPALICAEGLEAILGIRWKRGKRIELSVAAKNPRKAGWHALVYDAITGDVEHQETDMSASLSRNTERALDALGVVEAPVSRPTRTDYALGILSLILWAGVFATLSGLVGCSNVVTVRTDALEARAVRAWVTVGHVSSRDPVWVRDRWYEGDVLCDPVTTRLGPKDDRITLLLPRCEDYGKTGPGDSGSPIIDEEGRVVGLHIGRLGAQLQEGKGDVR